MSKSYVAIFFKSGEIIVPDKKVNQLVISRIVDNFGYAISEVEKIERYPVRGMVYYIPKQTSRNVMERRARYFIRRGVQ